MSNNNFSIGLGKKKNINMLNKDINFKFKYPSYLKMYQKFKTKNQNHLINIFNNMSINNNNNSYKKKTNSFLSIPFHLLLNNLLYKKYLITPSTYNKYIIQQLIDKKNTHLYITFKEMKILNKNNEYFKRYYNNKEINDRIPKYYLYYKNYLTFFCRPQINEFFSNKILMKHMEKEAEVFYKENYADEDTEILEKKEQAKHNKNKYENIFNKNVVNDIEKEAKKYENQLINENQTILKRVISSNEIINKDLNINNFDDISKINTILTNSNLQSITNTNNRLNTNNTDNSCINIIVKLLTGRKEKNNKKSSKSQKVSNANSKIEICLDSNNFNSNSKIKSFKNSKKNSKINSNINSIENNNNSKNNNNNIINNNINNIYNYHTHNHISKFNVKKIIYSPKISNNNNILYKKPIEHKLILNSINEFNNPFILNYSLSNKNIKFKNMYNTNLNSPKLNSKFNFYQSKSKINIYSNNNNIKNLENILKNLPYNNISHQNKNIKLSKNPKMPISNVSLLINSPIQLYSTQSKKIRSNSNIMGREKSPYSTTFLSRNSSDFSPRISKGRNHFSSYKNNLHKKKNSVRFEESTGTNSRNYINNIPLIRINSGILNVKNKFGMKKYGKLNHNIINFIKNNKGVKKNINKKNNLSSK